MLLVLVIVDGASLEHYSTCLDDMPINHLFDVVKLIDTRDSKNDVGDSASGATHIAVGAKPVRRRQIGITGKTSWFREACQNPHIQTGIITSSYITDATPAAFIAQTSDRSHNRIILNAMLNANPDTIVGCGLHSYTISKLRPWCEDTGRRVIIDSNGVTQHRSFDLANEANIFLNSVEQKQQHGVLVIEAGQIDVACHNQDVDHLEQEMNELCRLLHTLKLFQNHAQCPVNIVMTSDHATGGVQVRAQNKVVIPYDDHTGHLVPMFVAGSCCATLPRECVIRQFRVGDWIRAVINNQIK